MTKIDFHILPTTQESDVFHYVARLAQKALSRNHTILIATNNEQQALMVSDALWSCTPDSFLAHSPISEAFFNLQISHTVECGEHHDILINLCTVIPEYFSRFERIFEIVCQEPHWLTTSRDRYRFYNDHGYAIERHDLRERA